MLPKICLILAGVTTAIMAGLFFAWSFSVMLGLGKLSDREFISAMQSMNKEIQNPVFFIFFFGATVFLPLATISNYQSNLSLTFWFLLIATLAYLLGVMGVTIFGNIPLNNILDGFQLNNASIQEIALQRTQFENPWNRLNFIRTLSSFISILFVILACVYRNDK